MILFAMDRAPESVQRFDDDGRLHVATSPISKAQVREYYGAEVPNARHLNLTPDRLYYFLCPGEELEKAAQTFNNLQVLSEHVPVHAWNDISHRPEITVGSTGTDAEFDGEYLNNSLVIWEKASIDGIVNKQKRELSSAYRFDPEMTPGKFQGVDYDGVMRNIRGNHVALVIKGRAGPDVAVGDEKPMAYKSKKALMLAGGLGGLLATKLAKGSTLDLSPVLGGVTAASLAMDGAARLLGERVFGTVQPLLAADAGLDVEDVCRVIDAVKSTSIAEDDEIPEQTPAPGIDPNMTGDEDETDEEKEARLKREADEKDKPAMDAVAKLRADMQAVRIAEREVSPVVGELPVMDSAAEVYAIGLKALGADMNGLPKSAFGPTFRTLAAARVSRGPAVVGDAKPGVKATSDFSARFPGAVRLIRG